MASFRQEWHEEIQSKQGNEDLPKEGVATKSSESSEGHWVKEEKANTENHDEKSSTSGIENEKEEEVRSLDH